MNTQPAYHPVRVFLIFTSKHCELVQVREGIEALQGNDLAMEAAQGQLVTEYILQLQLAKLTYGKQRQMVNRLPTQPCRGVTDTTDLHALQTWKISQT